MIEINLTPVSMIVGTGSYLPSKILSNFDLEKMFDTTDEWIRTRTGIKQRAIVENGTITSDLCKEASLKALEEAEVLPKDLDLIIVGTITGDVKFPSTACYVQKKLGAVNAAAFDISAACSGFLYGVSIADHMMKSSGYKNILVIGTEILSSITNWKDRNTSILFGDGAGACVMKKSDGKKGILGTYIKSDGTLSELLTMQGGGTKYPDPSAVTDEKLNYISMKGREVFKHAITNMVDAANLILNEVGLKSSDIDLLIPHQANIRIIEAVAKKLKIQMDNVFINLDKHGNTSAASIPIALDEARKEGRINEGDLCLIVVFGGGFTWGSAVIRF
ncbi:beta-ketoacyl-ACP synthase III [candidate division KSB1 bacterium]